MQSEANGNGRAGVGCLCKVGMQSGVCVPVGDCGLAVSGEPRCWQHHAFPAELDTAEPADMGREAGTGSSLDVGRQTGPVDCALGASRETQCGEQQVFSSELETGELATEDSKFGAGSCKLEALGKTGCEQHIIGFPSEL